MAPDGQPRSVVMTDDANNTLAEPRPHGAWCSILDAAGIAGGVSTLSEPRVLDGVAYWLESRPRDGGRTTLMCADASGSCRELTPPPYDLRSQVHEYGGGTYLPTPFGVMFVNGGDQNIYRLSDGDIVALTEGDADVRYADFCLDAARRRLILVSERHPPRAVGNDRAEPRNALEVLDLERPGAGTRVLHQGRDFYAAPRLSPDGQRLAFLAWDHPNMPWDGTELRLLELTADGGVGAETQVAGGAAESVLQPSWMADGTLLFASDHNGYWNLYRFGPDGTSCLLEDDAEYAEPPWTLAQSSFTAAGDGHVVAVRRALQHAELMLLDIRHGFATPLASPWQEFHGLTCQGGVLYFIGSRDDQPTSLVRMPLDLAEPIVVTQATMPSLPLDWISRAQPLRFPTRDGAWAYAYYYPPTNPRERAPAGERPPLLVMTHGGPTGHTSLGLNLRIQFFTSRGFAVVDVDYRGSSGYGRAYRKALDGRWGILEVADCEDAVAHLVSRELADPRRVAIRGGSAGGFTTLSALTRSRVFAAGASHYGIGDLTALAAETHKFESRYLDALVGDAAALEQRSPIRYVDDLACPVIFFQGRDDRVVPPGQARAMVAALERKGLPVAYLEFDGESHGFRRAENIQRALECEYAFYCRVLGIEPHDPLPTLEIRNL
jgi:dipeptidyl aminopeptidase/acylaminoacyl peptidase